MQSEYKKYFIVLIITSAIFAGVFGMVNFLNNRKIAQIQHLQENISVDLLATETQFDLLKTLPCDRVQTSILSRELSDFGKKLSFAEESQGADDPSVLQLKKNYSLLQVKDYLLMQELSKKCSITTDFILYFYEQDCPECIKQGYILTEMKQNYPSLRIYSFDRNLDFAVMDSFIGSYNVKEYPSLIINNKLYRGFHTVEDLEQLLPDVVKKKQHDDLVEEGKVFILEREIYSDDIKNIHYVSDNGKTFTYKIDGGENGEEVTIILQYDKAVGFVFKRT